jgi:hypothetical protein
VALCRHFLDNTIGAEKNTAVASPHKLKEIRMVARTLFFVLTVVSMAWAQSTAMLKGTISDATGAVIPGAQILVRNQSTGIERTTVRDETGNYQIPAMVVGGLYH